MKNGINISKYEKEIAEYLRNNGINLITQYPVFKNNVKSVIIDLVSLDNRRCIEFNGDYWHANPEIYEQSYYNKRMKLTAKAIWERDQLKKSIIEENGFSLMVIWERDYINNKEKVLENCLNYMKK